MSKNVSGLISGDYRHHCSRFYAYSKAENELVQTFCSASFEMAVSKF